MSAEIHKLSNRLTLITETVPDIYTSAIGVWVQAGSRFEKINGLAHFLEHMVFKGTKTRTARQLTQEIENCGGNINAFTSREETAYVVRIMSEDIDIAIDILADMMIAPLFAKQDLTSEREVVLQEILQSYDNPEDVLFDLAQKHLFPAHTLGQPILGTKETLNQITANDLRGFMQDYYAAPNMIISAVGNIDKDKIIDSIGARFAPLHGQANHQPANHDFAKATYSPNHAHHKMPIEQFHFCMMFQGHAHTDPELYSALAFSEIFGETMSSRLFQKIREELGLAYTIQSFMSPYHDCGLFGIYAATTSDKQTQLIDAIKVELANITNDLHHDEITMAKKQLLSRLYVQHENIASRMQSNAHLYHLHGKIISIAEKTEKIKKIDHESLTDFASNLQNQPPCLFSVSNDEGLDYVP